MLKVRLVLKFFTFFLIVACTESALWWWDLTDAAESLLPEAEQHVGAHATVGRFVKMLHPPHVLPVLLDHLRVSRRAV